MQVTKSGRPLFTTLSFVPLFSAGFFAITFTLMNALDTTWGPNDIYHTLFLLPILPLAIAFSPWMSDLIYHYDDLKAALIFGVFCYALSASLYLDLYFFFLKGKKSIYTLILLVLLALLFALQSLLCHVYVGKPA